MSITKHEPVGVCGAIIPVGSPQEQPLLAACLTCHMPHEYLNVIPVEGKLCPACGVGLPGTPPQGGGLLLTSQDHKRGIQPELGWCCGTKCWSFQTLDVEMKPDPAEHP